MGIPVIITNTLGLQSICNNFVVTLVFDYTATYCWIVTLINMHIPLIAVAAICMLICFIFFIKILCTNNLFNSQTLPHECHD